MPMYNLIEYSDNYSKTPGSLWQYCKDIPAVDNNNNAIIMLKISRLSKSGILSSKFTNLKPASEKPAFY